MQTQAEANKESLEIRHVVVFTCNTSIKLCVLIKTFIIVNPRAVLNGKKRNAPRASCLFVEDRQDED